MINQNELKVWLIWSISVGIYNKSVVGGRPRGSQDTSEGSWDSWKKNYNMSLLHEIAADIFLFPFLKKLDGFTAPGQQMIQIKQPSLSLRKYVTQNEVFELPLCNFKVSQAKTDGIHCVDWHLGFAPWLGITFVTAHNQCVNFLIGGLRGCDSWFRLNCVGYQKSD